MLERFFQDKKSGFYVDIGAWDPNAYSVTRHFYLRGWRGLNVEPIASRHEMFVAERPRDINLRALVGSAKGMTTFFECVEEDYLSTTMPDVAELLRSRGLTVNEYDVDVEHLDALLERHCPKEIDFLKIDVEGAEADVLKTIAFKKFRPRALVIESTIPGSGLKSWDEPDAYGTWAEWEDGVLSKDYVFARFDGLNRYYVRREDAALADRLALPPGIFDGIDPSFLPQVQLDARLRVIEHQEIQLAELHARIEAAEQHRLAAEERLELVRKQQIDIAVLQSRCEIAERWAAQREEQAIAAQARSLVISQQQADIEVLRERVTMFEGAAEARLKVIEQEEAELASLRERVEAADERSDQLERAQAELRKLLDAQIAEGEAHDERFQATSRKYESDLAAASHRVDSLERDLSKAREALVLFEQWFDQIEGQPGLRA